MILLSTIATNSHAWRPLMINIVTDNTVDGTVVLWIRVVVIVVVVAVAIV